MTQQPSFSLYSSAGSTRKRADITVSDLLAAVSTGRYGKRSFAPLIAKIRATKDKKERDALKVQLPGVTLSGVFAPDSRLENQLQQHSGLIQVDFDEVEDPEFMLSRLQRDPYTLFCFISPSGNGVKAAVQIPVISGGDFEQTAADHRRSFYALQKYYRKQYRVAMDSKCKDMSRLLFLSHSTLMYHNEAAQVFTEKKDEPRKKQQTAAATADSEFPHSKLFLPATGAASDQREDVEHVLQQITSNSIDITGNYEDWVKLAFALSHAFGEDGRGYFHELSRFYPGYDHGDADKQYSEAAKQRKTGVTIKYFFHHAKQYGIDIASPRSTKGSRPAGQPARQQQKAIPPAAPPQQVTDAPLPPDAAQPITTAVLEQLKTPIPGDCENNSEYIKQYDFYYCNSCYYIEVFINRKKTEQRISNFIMQFLYFFPDGTNNAKRLIKLQNNDGHIELIELYAKELMSVSALKAAVSSKGNFFFFGTQFSLDKIIEFQSKGAQTAQTITVLGWQRQHSIYAFSNGIINAENAFIPVDGLGMVTDNGKSYFLPALSPLNDHSSQYVNEQRFIYQRGSMSFETYARLMYGAYGDNGAVSVAYLVASIMRDIIFAYLSSFPFLFLFGEPGAGKTSYTDLHLAVFGKPQAGIALSSESTTKSIARKLSQFANALIYLKEYSNSIAPTTIGLLKTAWEGVGYDRAQTTNDNRTHQTGVYSGLIIDGNELPEKNSALFSRCVTLGFEKNEFSQAQTKAFKELKAAAAEGLGQVFTEIHQHRQEMKERFLAVYNELLQWLKAERCAGLNLAERTLEHIAVLLTPVRVLEKLLPFHCSSLKLAEILITASTEQTNAMRQANEIQIFFAALEFLSSERRIYDGRHYRFIRDDFNRNVLSLAFARVYPLYVEYCHRQGIEPTGKMSLLALIKSRDYFLQYGSTKPGDTLSDKVLQTSCYRLDYDRMNISLERVGGLPASE